MRYILGVILAAILMAIIMPLFGIPISHMVPPSWSYSKADGVARGIVYTKYYDVTNNPFNVGGHQFFIEYKFRAKAPGPKGQPDGGPVTLYSGVMHLSDANKAVYTEIPSPMTTNDIQNAGPHQMIPTYPMPVKIRYVKDYPDINGIDAPWGARNIGAGSNSFSGWIIWLVVLLIVGYGFMTLFERFSHNENL